MHGQGEELQWDLPGARSIPARGQPGYGDAGSRDTRSRNTFAAGRGHFATSCQILQTSTLCKYTSSQSLPKLR